MAKLSLLLTAVIVSFVTIINGNAQSKKVEVDHFDKVIVSPHIQVTFQEGNEEAVTIESSKLSEDKINIEVVGKTLRIYLDGAKMVTKNETVRRNGWKQKTPIYKGTQVIATVSYKRLKELSLRGEEIFKCESPIKGEYFKLKIYGESHLTMNEVTVNKMQVALYGESIVDIKGGEIQDQKYTVYGEGKVNTLGIKNENTKITAYGESSFRVNVSENLKITAFGEATVAYTGNPIVNKGIVIGEATIQRMK